MRGIHSDEHVERFANWLILATERIKEEYMMLPVAGAPRPIYRERVYCYELYHQLRLLTEDVAGYTLGGEVDKAGHPIMMGPGLTNAKPDLLFHRTGDMRGNLVVVEVKPFKASRNGIRKDLKLLTAFRRRGQYEHAIYLVYGGGPHELDAFIEKARRLYEEDTCDCIELGRIALYWHKSPCSRAVHVSWHSS